MKLGLYLRNMGPQSTREMLVECTTAAEALGIDDVWVADHIAIPPDDAEGSEGRYLDPLATLAYLAGVTKRIGLGVGVLVLPYRPPLPTAKWVATIQELSGGRLLLGVGSGWMKPEFRAVGVDFAKRAAITDATLEFFQQCFQSDEIELNGQRLLFRPRPAGPPLFIGGAAPHGLKRALRFDAGWMPIGLGAPQLAPVIAQLREMAESAGKPMPPVVIMTSLPLDDPSRAAAEARAYADAGATGIVHGWRYPDAAAFRRVAEVMAGPVRSALAR